MLKMKYSRPKDVRRSYARAILAEQYDLENRLRRQQPTEQPGKQVPFRRKGQPRSPSR